MATIQIPVRFGWACSSEARQGYREARQGYRMVECEDADASRIRAAVQRGTIALHGPENPRDADNGIGFRLIHAAPGGGWNVGDPATVKD